MDYKALNKIRIHESALQEREKVQERERKKEVNERRKRGREEGRDEEGK